MEGWKESVSIEVLDRVADRLIEEYKKGYTIYPPLDKIYFAMDGLPPEDVRVVIIGQDPYHGGRESEGQMVAQAHGLSFSVQKGFPIPPSLQNIFKVLRGSGFAVSGKSGDLSAWKKQGILLLNRSLTVRAGEPGSHEDIWTEFANTFIPWLAKKTATSGGAVAMLWGAHAQTFSKEFSRPVVNGSAANAVITTSHPSPFSANKGFLTSDCFRVCNQKLKAMGRGEIDWSL